MATSNGFFSGSTRPVQTIGEQLADAADLAAYCHRKGGLDHPVPTGHFPWAGSKGHLNLWEASAIPRTAN